MADRPIIFSAPMIQALLDGRKSQTRRLIHAADLLLACGFLWGAASNHADGEPMGLAGLLALWFLIMGVMG